jgi:hypothetical protein
VRKRWHTRHEPTPPENLQPGGPTKGEQFMRAMVLRTVSAVILASLTWFLVALTVGLLISLLFTPSSKILLEIVAFFTAIIAGLVGMAAARAICDKLIKFYAKPPLFIFFASLATIGLVFELFLLKNPQEPITVSSQMVAVIVAAYVHFWRREEMYVLKDILELLLGLLLAFGLPLFAYLHGASVGTTVLVFIFGNFLLASLISLAFMAGLGGLFGVLGFFQFFDKKSIIGGLRSNLGKSAKSNEVKAVLAEIDAIEKEEGTRGLRQIKGLVVELVVGEADKTINSIRNDDLSPRTLAFLLILNVLGEELTSGQYHIYRGVLSTGGKMLLGLWVYAVEQQKQSGFYNEQEARKELKWIMDEIKLVG